MSWIYTLLTLPARPKRLWQSDRRESNEIASKTQADTVHGNLIQRLEDLGRPYKCWRWFEIVLLSSPVFQIPFVAQCHIGPAINPIYSDASLAGNVQSSSSPHSEDIRSQADLPHSQLSYQHYKPFHCPKLGLLQYQAYTLVNNLPQQKDPYSLSALHTYPSSSS